MGEDDGWVASEEATEDSGVHINKGSQPPASSVPSCPAPTPSNCLARNPFMFTMNMLLFGRQSKPRNGIRLSLCLF